MTSLLDNELVRRYFGCDIVQGPFKCDSDGRHCHEEWAYRVLLAMQEPIKKGERYLHSENAGKTWEEGQHGGAYWQLQPYHPFDLRLPSRFQAQGKKCDRFRSGNGLYCSNCGGFQHNHQPPPPEEKKCTHRQFCICMHRCKDCQLKPSEEAYGKSIQDILKDEVVEEKINEIHRKDYGFKGGSTMKWNDLCELVELVKKDV